VKHELENISVCPICRGDKYKDYLNVVDHNYSKEKFTIVCCENCGFKFTNPRPKENTIAQYYKSDNYISHTSSNKGLFNKLYIKIRNYQFKKKLAVINSLSSEKEGKLLDVGCGTGDFLNFCGNNDWICSGVEVDEKAREIAINRNNKNIVESIDQLIEEKETYDVITLWHVLEHIYNINEYLSKIKYLLKEGGVLILGLPNNESYDAKHYKENWYAYDVPIHCSHFTKKDIIELSKNHKLKFINSLPLIFDAYYISILSARKAGNSFISSLCIAWRSNRIARKNREYSSLMYILRK
jgi:2-polyprenyl-3-methyl-5-hydroxy-6-metoxy-1,4-benzoquinol methylase